MNECGDGNMTHMFLRDIHNTVHHKGSYKDAIENFFHYFIVKTEVRNLKSFLRSSQI